MSESLPPYADEQLAWPWRVERFDAVAGRLLDVGTPGRPVGRPIVIAVDGRSAGGKTVFAERLSSLADRRAVVIHTDDIAWHQAIIDWADLLADSVLAPVHRGEAVRYRPPAWDTHGRAGGIEVPSDADLVIVEGVGSSRRELARWYDATVWVQSDRRVAKPRGIARDGGSRAVIDFWDVWEAEEAPFFAVDQPWERADLVVSSTSTLEHDPIEDVVTASPGRLQFRGVAAGRR